MRAIFISYRRNDSEGEAGRLFDDLVGHFGEDSVFMDVSAIEAGRDFRKAIDESVATCGVLLAIIGNNWVDSKNDAGLRRLDDPADFVRLETAAALRRDIPVIPVLIRGAKMPRPEQLPDDLKDLAYRNGVELTHARWGSDIQLLIKALDTVLGPLRRAGTTESPPSGGHAADGATLVERPLEKNANGKPSSGLPAARGRFPYALMTLILIFVAGGGYWIYRSYYTELQTGSPISAYQVYHNKRLHYSISYPPNLLSPQGESADGSSQRFVSKDSRALLIITGTPGRSTADLRELYERQSRGATPENPTRVVTYKVKKDDWFVVSGYEQGRIWYEKTIATSSILISFRLEYDESQKQLFDSVVGTMAKSFAILPEGQ
jgi:hypothetical protein